MPVILSFINTIIWSIISIKFKNIRSSWGHPLSVFWIFCFALPLWIWLFIYLYLNNTIIFNLQYYIYVLTWIICVIITNIWSIYLYKIQSLSEQGVYRLCFSTIVALMVDIYYFKVNFNYYIIFWIVLLFIAWWILSSNKTKKLECKKTYIKSLLIIIIMSIMWVIQSSSYKLWVVLQSNAIMHWIMSQILLYFIVWIIWFGYIKKDIYNWNIKTLDIITISILVFLLSIFESVVIKELSITVITLLWVLNILIIKIYDIRSKEIHLSYSTAISFIFIVISLMLINIK